MAIYHPDGELSLGQPRGARFYSDVASFNPAAWLAANTVAYWRMAGASGAGETDRTLRGNDLVAAGSVGSAAGKLTTARSFASASDQYLRRDDTTDLQPGSGDFIIAAWVKPSANASVLPVVAANGSGIGLTTYSLTLSDNGDGTFLVGWIVTSAEQDSAAAASFGSWHLVIGRANLANGDLRLSIDNVTEAASGDVPSTPNAAHFYVGANNDAGGYDGLIDDVLIARANTPMNDAAFDALCAYLWNGGNGRQVF